MSHRCNPPRQQRSGGDVRAELKQLGGAIRQLTKEIKRMAREIETLTADVAAATEVDKSAIILIEGIAKRLADAGTDPAKLDALHADLSRSTEALAAAVAANTPAEPPA